MNNSCDDPDESKNLYCPTFGDEKGQLDYLINSFYNYQDFGLPRDGFFLDIGAADGVTASNTFFLEYYLGWRGLLFEPNPKHFESIGKSRTAPLIRSVLADKANSTIDFRVDNGNLGGIVGESFDNNWLNRGLELQTAEIHKLPTTTLYYELKKFSAPAIIDFMSMDVEGAEYFILKDFPFSEYKFRAMVIERPTPSLDLLLDLHGYRQVKHLNYDVFYSHVDYLRQINHSPSIRFKFTPRKTW